MEIVMNLEITEVLNRIESEVATHASALSGLAKLTDNDENPEISDVFNAMSTSANSIIQTINFFTDEIEKQHEAP
jgi:methyl-accepting chemotaxis protein